MQAILEAIETGLVRGCGISLTEAMSSPRFVKLLARQKTLFERYPKDTHRGIALRAGHLVMGQLLNTMPESKALAQARRIKTPKFGCGIELRALIQFFGEALIVEAGKCLPDEVLELAKEWRAATAERQIEIVRELFFIFRSKKQGDDQEIMTLAHAEQDLIRKAMEKWNRGSDARDVLPRLYGKWDSNCPANCQGKTQLLVAFAHLAGTKAMVVNALSDGVHELWRLRGELADAISQDIRRRGLGGVSSEFDDSLAGHHFAEIFREKIRDFHVGTALRLGDGRWILIDPHALAWGVFSPRWQMNETHRLLRKYAEVLPGLTLTRDDGGEVTDKIKARAEVSYDLIERSRKLEILLREQVHSMSDFIDIVKDSEDFDLLMRLNAEHERTTFVPWTDPKIRFLGVASVVAGGMDKLHDFRAMIDPKYLEQQIKLWLSFYHCVAANHLANQLGDNGELVHLVCEFNASPEYYLALSATNSIIVREDEESESFFIDYGFDQLTLYNTMIRRKEAAVAAAEVVKTLPFVHENMRTRFGI
ncbi:MAG: hypothetical protein WC518_02645 [Patescibacteria group bacterium]